MTQLERGIFQPSQIVSDRYQIIEFLGGGEKTEVYKAKDLVTDRVLALKVLREAREKEDGSLLSREFYYLSKLSHPNIVAVYDYGTTPDQKPYFTMEYVPGVPITKYFSAGYNPNLIEVITQLLLALDFIHSQGFLHCDLKPQNILILEKNGKPQAKLLDFGFAERVEFSKNLTAKGTLGYIAPEIFQGTDADARADLYSLGIVLYETLTGIGPGEGKELYEWLDRQYRSQFPPPRQLNPEIPEDLEGLILRLISPNRERRPISALNAIHILTKKLPEEITTLRERRDLIAAGFVGRKKYLARLQEHLQGTVEGKPRVVCISGERGVGKSRLVSEFKFFAQLQGATVFAFEPVSLGARSQSLIEALINILHLYGTDIEFPLDTSIETKFRLFDTVTQRLKSLADSTRIRHNLVIIIDDFEIFDATSLEFLRYLTFSLEKERIFVVVVGLKEARLLNLIEELTPKPYFEHISIPPLDSEEIKEMVVSLLGEVTASPPLGEGDSGVDTLAGWLFTLTGGNPLWTIEAVYALMENKIISREGLHWSLATDKLNTFQVPQTVIDVVRRRVETLNPEERAVLEVGATANGPFTVDLLRTVLSLDERVLLNAITHLKALGFLRMFRALAGDESIPLDTYILSSKILETAVIEKLSPNQHRELHRRVALALELLYPEKINEMVFELAHHWTQAGVKDRAYRYSIEAGEKAKRWLLFEQALTFYENALTLSKENLISFEERVQLIETVGKLREATGKFQEALDLYQQGMELALAHPEHSLNKRFAARFLRFLGLVHQKLGQHSEAIALLQQALLMEPDRFGLNYARILADLGWSYCASGSFGQADQALTQAAQIAENRKPVSPFEAQCLLALTFYYLSVLAYSRSDLYLSQQLAERALNVYESVQEEIMGARVKNFIATLCLRRGEGKKAKQLYQEALTIQRRSGDVYSQLRSLHGLGLISQEEGKWDEAYQRFDEALRLAERIGDLASQVNLNSMMATVCAEKGDWRLAQHYLQGALALGNRAGEIVEPSLRVKILSNFAQLMARRGDLAIAEDYLKEAVAALGQTSDRDARYYLLFTQAEVALRAGMFENSKSFLAEGFLQVRQEMDSRKLGLLYTLAANLRLTTGSYHRAKYDATRALKLFKSYPTDKGFPIALRLSGLAKCHLGYAEVGKEEIKQSIRLFRKLGLKYELGLSLLASAEALLRIARDYEYGKSEEFRIEPDEFQEVERNLNEGLTIFQELDAKLEIARAHQLLNEVKRVFGVAQLKAGARSEYLKVLYQISELIYSAIEKEDFLEQVLDRLLAVTKAERGLIFLLNRDQLFPVAIRGTERATMADAEAISYSILREVKERSEPLISANALTDPRFNSYNSVVLNKIRSLLCVPLIVEDRVLGTIYLDSRITSHLWTEDDRNLLIAVANLLATTIERSLAFQMIQEEEGLPGEEILIDNEKVVLGRSKVMGNVYQAIDRIAPTDSTVLLTGETGTGKGVLAQLIHQRSNRRNNKFISVNCSTLPETLFESELFGYIQGSFTGAIKDKVGIFETANGGTVFLDDITNTTPLIQAKLLQVLEEKIIRRVGDTEQRTVDVRLICATNKDLMEEVKAGRFREDLFYRINVVTIHVPPLRERTEDIPILADYFLRRYAVKFKKPVFGFEDEVISAFIRYNWPGNVRELQNAIERAVILTPNRILTLKDFGPPFNKPPSKDVTKLERKKRRVLRKEEVIDALKKTNGNISHAAKLLSTHRRTLQRVIKRLNLDPSTFHLPEAE